MGVKQYSTFLSDKLFFSEAFCLGFFLVIFPPPHSVACPTQGIVYSIHYTAFQRDIYSTDLKECTVSGKYHFVGNEKNVELTIFAKRWQKTCPLRPKDTMLRGIIEIKRALFDVLASVVLSPQPGIGRGRERDGISMRDGCGKGAGIQPQFPHTRYSI